MTNKLPRLIRTTIMLPEELNRQIRELADAGDRPLSAEIRRAIAAHVDREKTAA